LGDNDMKNRRATKAKHNPDLHGEMRSEKGLGLVKSDSGGEGSIRVTLKAKLKKQNKQGRPRTIYSTRGRRPRSHRIKTRRGRED